MPPFARRFRRNAGLVVMAAVVSLIATVVSGTTLIAYGDVAAGIAALAIGVALAGAFAASAAAAMPRSRALRQVLRANPHGAVFLARRQPAVVSDLVTFVGGQSDVLDQVSDRWVVASIDDRGLSAWSVTRTSRELLLMPWTLIGSIDRTPLEDRRPGIAVDVKPFATPLIVAVGYTAFGVLAPFLRRGVDEVITVTETLRPVAD